MKKLAKLFVIIFFVTVVTASCAKNECSSAKSMADNIDITERYKEKVMEDSLLKEALDEYVPNNNATKICSPLFIYNLNLTSNEDYDNAFSQSDIIIFPIAADEEPIGFALYYIIDDTLSTPMFMPISDAVLNKIQEGHYVKIAYAKWESKDGLSEYCENYIFISDDNYVDDLFENCPLHPHYKIQYKSVIGLSELSIDSFAA